MGAVDWSDAQRQALTQYYREYDAEWINAIILEQPLHAVFNEGTLAVVRRRMMQVLGLEVSDGRIDSDGVFVTEGGLTTVSDICNHLERGEMVIVDTSSFDGATEILVGSTIATELLYRYKRHKLQGTLASKPVISIILEEAPRVLGKDVLEQGPNVFATIAREGRKFKIGLTAITQLPSLIPREILANMNTKIILGLEMKAERLAMIESASQDLSTDDRAIASLDKGEAIVTSTFVPFALPIRIPLFDEFCAAKPKQVFGGVKLG
jgi:DNA helicase HerA-like ATPase